MTGSIGRPDEVAERKAHRWWWTAVGLFIAACVVSTVGLDGLLRGPLWCAATIALAQAVGNWSFVAGWTARGEQPDCGGPS